MTRLLYRDDPYLLEFDARVVERLSHDGRPAVVLDRTAFYAESGGQPWDTGTIEGVPVVAVLHRGDDVLHVLGQALAAETVHGRVDDARRRDHRQQHHGQHLLSRALLDGAGAPTTSFHLGETVSTIDVAGDLSVEAVRAAERRANDVIWAARPVTVRTVSRAEAAGLGVRPPEEAGDTIRIVEAEGFDRQPCGGTHPRNTSEVGVVVVVGQERYKGGTRVRFVCGDRALAAFHQRQAIVDETSAVLSSSPESLPDAARRLRESAAESDRRAARGESLPSVQVNADYGEIGRTASSAEVVEAWGPEVRYCLDAFGPSRCTDRRYNAVLGQGSAKIEDFGTGALSWVCGSALRHGTLGWSLQNPCLWARRRRSSGWRGRRGLGVCRRRRCAGSGWAGRAHSVAHRGHDVVDRLDRRPGAALGSRHWGRRGRCRRSDGLRRGFDCLLGGGTGRTAGGCRQRRQRVRRLRHGLGNLRGGRGGVRDPRRGPSWLRRRRFRLGSGFDPRRPWFEGFDRLVEREAMRLQDGRRLAPLLTDDGRQHDKTVDFLPLGLARGLDRLIEHMAQLGR